MLSPARAEGEYLDSLQQYNDFSELRFGVLAHDVKCSFKKSYEPGVSFNGEYLFSAPQNDFFQMIFSPHPHVGVSINSGKGTSMAYTGFTWELPLFTNWFVNVMVGGAVHNGETKKQSKHRKSYGSRFLFHTGLAVGYVFQERHTFSVMVDHASNARLCKPNPGVTDLGLRYGYRF